MSLITKIPGVIFTDTSLPKLYRDAVITAGTQFVFDADDTYSFAKQATPTPGVDVWVDLSPKNATAAFGSACPFDTDGFTTSTVTNVVTGIHLPASGKFGPTPAGFIFTYWFKYLYANTIFYPAFAGLSNNTSLGTHQYSIDNGNNNGLIRLVVDSAIYQFIGVPGTIYQLAVAAKKLGNGTYQLMTFKNGELVFNSSPGRTVLGQSTNMANPVIGASGGFGPAVNQKAYRCWYDDTSTLADQAAITALVLKDYNANVGRFS